MERRREYDDIQGSYVFDSRMARRGYALNKFCASLNVPENREAFLADEAAYLDRFDLSADQRRAVLERDWLAMVRLGGNAFFFLKLAVLDGVTTQQVCAQMTGTTEAEFVAMMQAGGRPPS